MVRITISSSRSEDSDGKLAVMLAAFIENELANMPCWFDENDEIIEPFPVEILIDENSDTQSVRPSW